MQRPTWGNIIGLFYTHDQGQVQFVREIPLCFNLVDHH